MDDKIKRLLSASCDPDANGNPLGFIDHDGFNGYRATDGKILAVVNGYLNGCPSPAIRIDPKTWEAVHPKEGTQHPPYPAIVGAINKADRGAAISIAYFEQWLDGAEQAARQEHMLAGEAYAYHKVELRAFEFERRAALAAAKAQAKAAAAALKPKLAGLPPLQRNAARAGDAATLAAARALKEVKAMRAPSGPPVPRTLATRPVVLRYAEGTFGYQLRYLRMIKASGVLKLLGATAQVMDGMLLIRAPRHGVTVLVMPVVIHGKKG